MHIVTGHQIYRQRRLNWRAKVCLIKDRLKTGCAKWQGALSCGLHHTFANRGAISPRLSLNPQAKVNKPVPTPEFFATLYSCSYLDNSTLVYSRSQQTFKQVVWKALDLAKPLFKQSMTLAILPKKKKKEKTRISTSNSSRDGKNVRADPSLGEAQALCFFIAYVFLQKK